MHPLVLLIGASVVGLYCYVRWSKRQNPAQMQDDKGAANDLCNSAHRIAFISAGKLFYSGADRQIKEIQSPFVQDARDRLERSKQLHGWKQGTAFGTSFATRGARESNDTIDIQATSAQFLGDDRVLYCLRDKSMGGLFELELSSGQEKRLLHRQNLLLEDLRLHPDRTHILCSQHAANGTANIVRMLADGNEFRELTGGDTLDTAPAWVPALPEQIVFQSAGLARNEQGYVIAIGPASIQLLDTRDSSLSPVVDDPRFDYLQPRVADDGSLLYIRRPHEAPRYAGTSMLMDALLFPFRLGRAVFHYLNFFSLMYTRKPLTGAGGPQLEADLKEILVKGKRIDAEQALRKGALVSGVRSLVPATWQLIQRNSNGVERVLASHVASFDIAPDGQVVFSNGNGAFALGGNGRNPVLLRDKLISELIVE